MLPAEGFQPTLLKVAAVLDRLGIRFHITGGLTSVAYGEPRLTQDIDLVVDRDRVLTVRDEFQLLDIDQVIKLDLYIRCLIPGELDRSVQTELFPGVTLPIVARTDAALSKLIWIHHGSHRSRRDLRRILAGATPDEILIVRRTAGEMDLEGLLDEVLAEHDGIDA